MPFRFFRSVLLGSVLALGCGLIPAGAVETTVEVTPVLRGAWVQPEQAWDGRAVLLLHGFADDMDGAGDLMKTLAHALAEKGVASLRLNLRGEGDRHRTDIVSTAQSRLEDALAGRAYLAARAGVDGRRVGAMGWSLGAVTALHAGSQQPEIFKSLALWSSPSGDLYANLTTGSFAAPYAEAMASGTGTLVVPGWKTITLHPPFFAGYRGLDFDAWLPVYPGAVLFVRGSEDYLPAREAELLKLARGRPAEAVLIGGADHVFNVFDPVSPDPARTVAVTVAWFERTL